MNNPLEVSIENLDHLGLVAGLIDEIGIFEKINEIVGEQPGEIVSAGQAVKAMILNGLGLVSAPLYLFSKFFEGKPTEHLIGEGIRPEHLNDDRLGRVLDKLYLAGTSEIFTIIALASVEKFKVNLETGHLDSSSFYVQGEYEQQKASSQSSSRETNRENYEKSNNNQQRRTGPIKITYGYSRDHRPDLKQFMIDLICSGDGDVPLFLRIGDGNEADSAVFAEIMQEFKQKLNFDTLMVADSALYSAPNIGKLTNIRWLSRVPKSLKQAQQLVSQLKPTDFTASCLEGYSWSEHRSNYGGVPQRWLVVESAGRHQSGLNQLTKKLAKYEKESWQKLRDLSRIEFACEADAIAATARLEKQLKYYKLTDIKLVPLASAERNAVDDGESLTRKLKVTAKLELEPRIVEKETDAMGRFILATNVMDVSQLSPDEMIIKYKEQQSAERGFCFLKDPLFFTSSVFLKSPERIEALVLVMGLCLLVYTLGQRLLRQTLEQTDSTVKNQLGKPTSRPTLRWIFQGFQSIHYCYLKGAKYISNLTEERNHILSFFPEKCRSYYLLI